MAFRDRASSGAAGSMTREQDGADAKERDDVARNGCLCGRRQATVGALRPPSFEIAGAFVGDIAMLRLSRARHPVWPHSRRRSAAGTC
ncbi:hypothetical protein CHELA40_13669 [Chelatococcus asaccharovorans]|nr:hypothetical protein CHELA40_13669 [Chelatococcus asaccharovorans]CAH1676448.1 hypothetical protein CHELA17_61956 [Chelatococcus asaccharovorans]